MQTRSIRYCVCLLLCIGSGSLAQAGDPMVQPQAGWTKEKVIAAATEKLALLKSYVALYQGVTSDGHGPAQIVFQAPDKYFAEISAKQFQVAFDGQEYFMIDRNNKSATHYSLKDLDGFHTAMKRQFQDLIALILELSSNREDQKKSAAVVMQQRVAPFAEIYADDKGLSLGFEFFLSHPMPAWVTYLQKSDAVRIKDSPSSFILEFPRRTLEISKETGLMVRDRVVDADGKVLGELKLVSLKRDAPVELRLFSPSLGKDIKVVDSPFPHEKQKELMNLARRSMVLEVLEAESRIWALLDKDRKEAIRQLHESFYTSYLHMALDTNFKTTIKKFSSKEICQGLQMAPGGRRSTIELTVSNLRASGQPIADVHQAVLEALAEAFTELTSSVVLKSINDAMVPEITKMVEEYFMDHSDLPPSTIVELTAVHTATISSRYSGEVKTMLKREIRSALKDCIMALPL